jgi:hypothetical protein
VKRSAKWNITFEEYLKKYARENTAYCTDKFHGAKTKLTIKCLKHNIVTTRIAQDDIRANGSCTKCKSELRRNTRLTLIEKANIIHNNKYDYSKFKNVGAHKNTTVICPVHGDFTVSASNHINNESGCPSCCWKESKGEKKIKTYLKSKNIIFIPEKSFDDLRSIKGYKLRFDFYLPESNTIIEYDGEHHFQDIRWNKTDINRLPTHQAHDKIKNIYCSDNNLHMIRISYKDYMNVEIILDSANLSFNLEEL